MLGTIHGMIQLQKEEHFTEKTHPDILCWNNATWASLVLLAACVVGPILLGAEEPGPRAPGGPTQTRFAVTHDLPKLHAGQGEIVTAWGTPFLTRDWGLVYKTNGSMTVFCLDHEGRTQKIIETQDQEEDLYAVATLCK
jgi:hypothetical protein